MKIIAIAVACAVGLVSNASFALEPWHDYYTAKAMKEKAAKKQAQKEENRADRPKEVKETPKIGTKDPKQKS